MSIILPGQAGFAMPQPIQPTRVKSRDIYIQYNTRNQSFLDMHQYLKLKGIKNNAFMLMLYDPDLAYIDPRDPNLHPIMKERVWRECMNNYWYFLREVVRIPDQGGSANGVMYKLHRGNLAFNFCSLLNINIFEILPRQQYKTISAVVRYLYLFNFGTTYSSMYFLNENHDKSKENLSRLKDVRAILPSYLRFNKPMGQKGLLKVQDSVEKLSNPYNVNLIKTVPSARNRVHAGNLIRGKTVPLIWFDEYAFIPFNTEIYLNGVPAYKTAAMNAQRNGKAYGIVITTTPGDMMTEQGADAYDFMNNCTKFDEAWYDWPYRKIMSYIGQNKHSNFVFIQYDYKQLGLSEEWLASICMDMQQKWDRIRREILLEWNISTPNAAFTYEQLEFIKRKVIDPVRSVYIFDKFKLDIYWYPEFFGSQPKYPPIIGVDVSGGFHKDYSAIIIMDSKTTMPFASFKDNSIDPDDLAAMIIEIVTKYMPNAIVNVEKTGIGASVVGILKKKIKKNLYYEIKDRINEERFDGVHVQRKKVKTKVYGFDNTKESRPLLEEILRERGRDHKDKFICKELYEEFKGLEVKKNGRVEHSDKSHDDLTFAYLMAMYVWTHGQNLTQWSLQKTSIKTDEDIDEVDFMPDDDYEKIVKLVNRQQAINQFEEGSEAHQAIIDANKLLKASGILYGDWEKQVKEEEDQAMQEILSTELGRKAFAEHFNVPEKDMNFITNTYQANYNRFYKAIFTDEESEQKRIAKNFNFEKMFMNVR